MGKEMIEEVCSFCNGTGQVVSSTTISRFKTCDCKIIPKEEIKQERSYSEEDVKYAYEQGAILALLSQSPLALHKGEFPNPEEWFNQYKEENKIWI
jgi:hypothetical protein